MMDFFLLVETRSFLIMWTISARLLLSSAPGFDPQDLPARSESLHRLCHDHPLQEMSQWKYGSEKACSRHEFRKSPCLTTDYITLQNFSYGKTRCRYSLPPRLGQKKLSSPPDNAPGKKSLVTLHFDRKRCRQLHLIRYAQLQRPALFINRLLALH